MKKHIWILSVLFCCSLLLAVGCSSLNLLGVSGSDSGSSTVDSGNSAVKFNFAFPANRHDKRIAGSIRNSSRNQLEKFSSIKITPFGNVKASLNSSASIGNIHIIVPGRPPRNQSAQTFPLMIDENGNASATINGLPENTTMVGVISLDGGVASGATDFIGAIHTHEGENDITVVPPGSLHEVDITANAILDVVNSSALAEAAPQNLYEPCHTSAQQVLDNTDFANPGMIPTEVLTDIINTQRSITPASYVHFTENPDNQNAVWGWNNSGRRMWAKENTDLWQPLDLWGTDINMMQFANVLKQGYDGNAYVGWQHSRLSPFGIMKMDLAGGRLTFVRNPGKCAQIITLSDNSVIVGGTNDDRRVPVLFRWKANTQGSTYSNAAGDENGLMWCRYFEQEYATAQVKNPSVTSMSYDNMKYLTVYVDSPTTPTGYRIYRINIINGEGGPIVDTDQIGDTIVVNKLPRIEFTQPAADNVAFQPGETIRMVASATDKDGVINKIQFMADSQILETREITTPAAHVDSVTYDWVGASIGTHSLAIIAFDNDGGSRLASMTVVILQSAQAPEATITAPAADDVFTVGETIDIEATVTDPNGDADIAKVEFFDGAVLLGETTSRPFQFAWVPATSGMANLMVRATDQSGATGDSERINILIIPPNQPPASPTITIPRTDEENVEINPVVQGSPFWDPDNGDTHQKTLWEIFGDQNLTAKVWSCETTTSLVSVRVDETTGVFAGALAGKNRLDYATTYWLQVRYQDSHNNWSNFSSPAVAFSTVAAPPPSLLTGIVQSGHSGNPLSNVSVTVRKDAYSVTATTNNSGVYSIQAEPGEGYEVIFALTDYNTVIYQDVTLEAGQSLVLDPVTLINPSMQKGNISGTIKDALTGEALEGVSISLRTGINNTAGAFEYGPETTDGTGLFTFTAIDAGNYTAEVTKSGYVTLRYAVTCIGGETTANQNNTITPELPEGNWRIVLTWGAEPRDLDSHFTGPRANGSRFHVCYWDRNPTNSGANLDVDDVDSYGPETVTVTSQQSGIYRYSVHNYSNRNSTNSNDLANSGAVVKVYKGPSLVRTFNVPPESGTLWTVFTLDGGEITPVNRMSYQSNDSVIPSIRKGTSQGGDIDILENLPAKR